MSRMKKEQEEAIRKSLRKIHKSQPVAAGGKKNLLRSPNEK